MSVTFDFCSEQLLSLDEVEAALSNAKRHYEYSEKSPGERHVFATLNVAAIARLGDVGDYAAFKSLSVQGWLSLAQPPFSVFERILNDSGRDLARFASVFVDIGYEEKESKQTKRNCDRMGVNLQKDRLLFSYLPHGSRVATDCAYRRTFFTRLIEIASLPLIVEDRGSHYRLVHAQGGYLWISGYSPPDLSPSIFKCELPGDSVKAALARLQRALADLASNKRFEYSWSAYLLEEHELSTHAHSCAEQMYTILVTKDFPAENYTLGLHLVIQRIEVVEHLRALCGPKDTMLVPLGGFGLPGEDEHYLNIEVETTARGHRLHVEASVPINVTELSANLGVELQEQGHH
jgi:hypothetical protein